ncbi:hypothetical protein PORY_000597 [Pneumocystis oryctolagi]|uniref:Uncharacterized protein n=1 Tax=Pneumocystis oryctolagi TaxID=42067 RepID=A0ACB7CD45_9ASCO|nr:hypothetical protein PORY_000597 [Pneumocystis oryctolagi]
MCGDNLHVWYVGNAPVGSAKCRQTDGAKVRKIKKQVFFMKARVLAGRVKRGELVDDWIWVTKEEMRRYVSKKYWEDVQAMLS